MHTWVGGGNVDEVASNLTESLFVHTWIKIARFLTVQFFEKVIVTLYVKRSGLRE